MNGHAKKKTRIGTVENVQNLLLREGWGRGMRLRQRTTDWVTHTSREHKEADLWAGKGARRRAEEWVETDSITWQEVLGICGTWDGTSDNCKCGGGIVFMALSASHTDGYPSTKTVVLYQGIAPWMLK